jgi:hypothetical protein
VVILKSSALWDVILYTTFEFKGCFGTTFELNYLGQRISQARSSDLLATCLACCFFS